MKLDDLKQYKNILILGYGIEGKATEKFLKKFHPKANIGIADQKYDKNYLKVQKDYDLAIRTPLLRPENITIPYTTATNIFFANVTQPIIGVTGTKGKSTTVTLLHQVLLKAGMKSQLVGNIGNPMLDAYAKGISDDDVFVTELSSYQLEDIFYSPDVACFLNIYEEKHNHKDYDEYFEAKTHIMQHQHSDDIFFYNGHYPSIKQLVETTQAATQDFTMIDISQMVEDAEIDFLSPEENLQAVWAMASYLGAENKDFIETLRSFKPLPHRLADIGEYGGITFYDDSGSHNPISTLFALKSIEHIDALILGGENRGADFAEVVQTMEEKNVQHVLLFPETESILQELIKKQKNYSPSIKKCASMNDAIEYVFNNLIRGSVCVLSPGAPSYSMYTNYIERGNDFVSTIKEYAKKNKNKKTNTKKTATRKTASKK